MDTKTHEDAAKRNKDAYEVMKSMPREDLADRPKLLKAVEALFPTPTNFGQDVLARIGKLVAAGVTLSDFSNHTIMKKSRKLPMRIKDIIGKKPGKIKKGKVWRHMRAAGEVRVRMARDAGHVRETEVRKGVLPVSPPNTPQEMLALEKRLCEMYRRFSVYQAVCAPDANGQWHVTKSFLIGPVTQPVGFFGVPTGSPEKPNRC